MLSAATRAHATASAKGAAAAVRAGQRERRKASPAPVVSMACTRSERRGGTRADRRGAPTHARTKQPPSVTTTVSTPSWRHSACKAASVLLRHHARVDAHGGAARQWLRELGLVRRDDVGAVQRRSGPVPSRTGAGLSSRRQPAERADSAPRRRRRRLNSRAGAAARAPRRSSPSGRGNPAARYSLAPSATTISFCPCWSTRIAAVPVDARAPAASARRCLRLPPARAPAAPGASSPQAAGTRWCPWRAQATAWL